MDEHRAEGASRRHLGLAAALLGTALIALWVGPVPVAPSALWDDAIARTIVLELRLPRVVAAALVGAALGSAGALLQALLRNPLADPALVGVSGGAALGAAAMLGLTGTAVLDLLVPVPLAAFAGAAAATALVWRLAAVRGYLHLAGVLLAGVAVNTLAGALVGLLLTFADDAALRSTTFWLFGSVADVGWPALVPLAVAVPGCLYFMERRGVDLDVYQLGDLEAGHAGLDVRRLQRRGLLAACLLTGLAVAVAGIIGFVGLMVPHAVRLLSGPGHRGRMLASGLAGAILLIVADALARVLAAPAEVPLGLLTALLGAPFFLALLRRELGRLRA